MGFAVSWLAVSGKKPQQILADLDLESTGQTAPIPESPLCCVYIPEGPWFVIFANCFDSPLVSEQMLSKLSIGCKVISCQVEEHIMFSSAVCHIDGARIWRVEHDALEGIYHLAKTGEVPPELADIHAASIQKQDDAGKEDAGVDFLFDVPIMLAKYLTSFRHDEDIDGADDEPFEVIQPKPATVWRKLWSGIKKYL